MQIRSWRVAAALGGVALVASIVAGCEMIAVDSAPDKVASTARTEAADSADQLFWERFHAGDYEAIPKVLFALEVAYLRDPGDAKTAAHIGWMHMWRLSESARMDEQTPLITDDATLARKYFQEAVTLDPSDARYLGFLASATLAEGSIHNEEKDTRRGYFELLDAVKRFPEFNLFTAGYVMSNQAAGSERFNQALEWQWQNLDVCVGGKVDRAHPDYAAYLSLETQTGPKRVCWNSAIAPHNFEGFFLNMGDMLVKSGDWQTAQKIYANARLSKTYASWPYREVLEARIENAQANVAVFQAPIKHEMHATNPDQHIMINTRFSCMGCHQASQNS